MDGLKITCYCDCGECAQRDPTGWCGKYDRMCEEVNAGLWKEDGEQ